MRALVVFESHFGNTEGLAERIAAGLSTAMEVQTFDVTRAPTAGDVDLLVVGAPTHAFGMSRPQTRRDVATETGFGSDRAIQVGLREWLATAQLRPGLAVAAFDTRVKVPGLPGSAARGAARMLKRRGCRLLLPSETFWVQGRSGPLRPGELDRARRWAMQVGAAAERQPSRSDNR